MGSGGGGGGGNPGLLSQNAAPMQGLPIAGQGGGGAVGNPMEYGKFQSFLPDIPAQGHAPMATGLRPDMFMYKSPSGVVAQSDQGNQIQELRDALAKLQAQSKPNQFGAGQNELPQDVSPNSSAGG